MKCTGFPVNQLPLIPGGNVVSFSMPSSPQYMSQLAALHDEHALAFASVNAALHASLPQCMSQLADLYDEKHWLYISALHNLGLMYEKKGDLAKAKDTLERVMRTRAQVFGK